VNCIGNGNAQIEDEKGHRDREDSVAQSSETLDTVASDLVVESRHVAIKWRSRFALEGYCAGSTAVKRK
jgi:hypothetical protein